MILEGLITADEKIPLQLQLEELLSNNQIASWFSPEWEVRTEVPVLLPGGIENRIDRLLIKEKCAVIVDFKTGEPVKADQKQVLEYMDVLRKMNFVTVEGYLLYIRTGDIVSVVPGKSRVVKKQDENQLGLGF
jgi:RecB family exonuclease